MIKIKEYFTKIKDYIENNYDIVVEETSSVIHDYILLLKAEKYDLEIAIAKTEEQHYLFGQCDYVLYYDYNANKKYRTELGWEGGGHSDGFNENDFANIDTFLSRWLRKKEKSQLTIFDLESE